MTERMKPYIGVSGVVNPEQQADLQQLFREHGLTKNRTLALGVKATHKTQYLNSENTYGTEWYPVGDEFIDALVPSDTFNVAQVYMEPTLLDNQAYKEAFIDRVSRRGKAWLHALQFDMLPWHTSPKLFDFLEQTKAETDLSIILQAHQQSMEHFSPTELVRSLGRRAHVIDYLLFDSSHGKGVRLTTAKLTPYVEAAYSEDTLSRVSIGIAGGLSGPVVAEALPEMIRTFPELSWDAEGQLHPTAADGTRPISLVETNSYFAASAEVLRAV